MKEHQHIEWKQSWRDEYLRWICGFANAEGGTLVIGRDDKGKAVGVKDARKLMEDIPNKVRDILGIMVDVNLRELAAGDVLDIVVPAYSNPISYRGEYCYRSGSTNQTLKGAALDRLRLTEGKYLRAGISYRRLQRLETLPVPEEALREALLNAVIQKDYGTATPIQISVYHDKLMIWNPGELPPDWNIARLTGKHPSQPYNPDVANGFFRAGMIEAWGRGIERILLACRAAGTPRPKVRFDHGGLWVVFKYAASADTTVARQVRVKTPVETRVETPVKTPVIILSLLKERPNASLAEVAAIAGKSLSAVERASAKLVKEGRLRFVGPRKGGRWQVLE